MGEAKNPGPVRTRKLKQISLREMLSPIDCRDEWARRNGMKREVIRGDGNCLYSAMATFLGADQGSVRHFIAKRVQHLSKHGFFNSIDLRELIAETARKGCWAGRPDDHYG